jgi:transient receptor potential cation channel subfamily M member 2
MEHYWKMPKPEVIITVTGGAQDFQLTRQQQVAFDRGLVSAAQSAKAWIFTAGSDTGVMRLVGNALAKYNVALPIVGVFPWGVVNERELLTNVPTVSSVSHYKPTPPTIDGAPLNPHHSHFVFVDNGTKGRKSWGSEIQLRSALEASISKAKGIPIVQLVVQGGPGTLQTVESTALAGKPIVVLTDTGGAATALHTFVTRGIDAVEPKFQKLEASRIPPVATRSAC